MPGPTSRRSNTSSIVLGLVLVVAIVFTAPTLIPAIVRALGLQGSPLHQFAEQTATMCNLVSEWDGAQRANDGSVQSGTAALSAEFAAQNAERDWYSQNESIQVDAPTRAAAQAFRTAMENGDDPDAINTACENLENATSQYLGQ